MLNVILSRGTANIFLEESRLEISLLSQSNGDSDLKTALIFLKVGKGVSYANNTPHLH